MSNISDKTTLHGTQYLKFFENAIASFMIENDHNKVESKFSVVFYSVLSPLLTHST